MIDDAAMHARRINEYEFKYGRKVVEEFLDAVLSIEEHIDPNFFIKKQREGKKEETERKRPVAGRFDDLISPAEREELAQAETLKAQEEQLAPEKDLIYFVMQHSPILQAWQRDIMSMVHDEMLYFVPQMQTKTLNEGWACLTGDALLVTEKGFMRFDQLYGDGKKIRVAGGGERQVYWIADFHKEERVPTIRLRTRRGLTIEGALKHRVLLADGTWVYLEGLKVGDRIALESGTNIWPKQKQLLNFVPTQPSATSRDVTILAATAPCGTAHYLSQSKTLQVAGVGAALKFDSFQPTMYAGRVLSTRVLLHTQGILNEDIAWILGYFIGDGHRTKSGICFTCGDEEYSRELAEKIHEALGLHPKVRWDPTEVGGRWRIYVHSRELLRFLASLEINLQDKARSKKIPPPILSSPKEVMSAFLRGYFDADAYAGPSGIRLSSSSEELIRTIQIVLLNYGILSTQFPQQDGCIQLRSFSDLLHPRYDITTYFGYL